METKTAGNLLTALTVSAVELSKKEKRLWTDAARLKKEFIASLCAIPGGGGELPIMAYRVDSFRKGYLVQVSSIRNGSSRNFTSS